MMIGLKLQFGFADVHVCASQLMHIGMADGQPFLQSGL